MSYIITRSILDRLSAIPKRDLDKSVKFINYLQYYHFDKEQKWINIPATFLKKEYGFNYCEVIDRLVEFDIVNILPYSNPKYNGYGDNKPFSYRISSDYIKWFDLSIYDSKTIIVESDKIQNKKALRDIGKLDFDFKRMLHAIEDYDISDQIIIDGDDCYYKEHHCFLSDLEAMKYNLTNRAKYHMCKQVAALYDKKFFASISSINGRLNTSLTFLNKNLIKHCSIYGEPLEEIDLRNSQSAFFAYLLSDFDNVVNTFPVLKKYKYPKYSIEEDMQEFINLSQNGILYDELAKIFYMSRNDTKNLLFIIMYADNRYSSQLKTMFKNRFPSVFKWIYEFKQLNKNVFAVMLQTIESSLFIDVIYARIKALKRNHERLTVFTKHDSILCRQSDYPIVKTLFLSVVEEFRFKCSY